MTHRRRAGSRVLSAAVCIAALLLAGCAPNTLSLAPPSPVLPWVPADAVGAGDNTGFSVPRNPAAAQLATPPVLDGERVYQLPDLIDIAQQNNPETRIAWQQARQAALAVGMVEATYLPMISASVIAGYQNTRTPLPLRVEQALNTTGSAVVPAIALQWLLFDFGQRDALAEAAGHASFAANVNFNGMHQKLIFDVTRTYLQYGVARSRTGLADEMLRNSRAIQEAAEQRRKNGIGTTIEVAQARQQVARSELRRVTAQGVERDAYQALLGAMGVSPLTAIRVGSAENRPLPGTVDAPTEAVIRVALSQRPDVLASYAGVKAATAGITAANAGFMPKVFLAGAVASGNGRFQLDGLPAIGPQTSGSTVLIGVTVPLYDGGLRATRVKEAESRAAAATEVFKKTQDLAVREIVVASDTLSSALESNRAALNLVDTARITFDAATEAYRHGVGTITIANEAANGLLESRQLSVDAHAAALTAAASLAFVMGDLTRPADGAAYGCSTPFERPCR
ncbi:TolC family protein [Variovorax sp. J22P168]|uniref:TolC family protein n=1 Tax=Variovorax jilinensis TaxID=3053513 RepID=UPI0025780F34|nr:TolC family protein [Variovorax sp. J22P168]MDM0014928.1 TolC family protein [Variovorax sp. J22P168]